MGNNATQGNKKLSLASLYDKVDSYIRALETLGVKFDICAAMTTDRLTKLFNFLQMEVENEECIGMALTVFGFSSEQETTRKQRCKPENTRDIPSASALTLSGEEINVECVFCKLSHESASKKNRNNPKKQDNALTMLEQFCSGEILLPAHIQKDLKCRYVDRGIPFLKIAPIKEEELYLDPKIVVYHDAIYEDEIETLKRLSEPRLEVAKVRNPITGGMQTSDYRIAKSVYIEDNGNKHIMLVRRRVEHMTGLVFETSKKFQIAYYDIGGFYLPHYDFVRKEDEHSLKDFGTGNRIATVLFYMNDVTEGGATIFPMLNITIWPKKGSAVFWHNLQRNGEGDTSTLHAACKVLSGEKWIATSWLHEYAQVFRRPCTLLENE
ncbi:prolyl 4-hydroxylase subunit alpha-1-like [Belonocnema kinseyi]|uniref:prolyl 4-hydroxylase subunit alpha-1-like n=1 Tax=Belonocnema kinseyi TaxID=2817044 RepID=UPI00143CC4A4|nr:prolyl 4-hydroxylase subunit alpha-1-like [Belonocnema kinseyi]